MDQIRGEILVVDGDPAHAELVRQAFSDMTSPYSVAVAKDVSAARRYIATHSPPALIFADSQLGDGDGMELIQSQPGTAPTPVVIMTGDNGEGVAFDAIRLGALDYIVKTESVFREMPVIAERVLRHWRVVLERQSAEEQLRRRVRELTALSAFAMAGAEAVDESALLHRVSELLKDELLFPNGIGIFMVAGSPPGAGRNGASDAAPSKGIADGVPISARILDSVVSSGVAQPLFGSAPDFAESAGSTQTQSGLCMPIKVRQRVVGVLFAAARAPDSFSDADARLLGTIASQLSTALERLRSASAVVESEARFRRLSEASLEGILLMYTDGVILDANSRLCELIGYSLEELLKHNVLDLVEPANREHVTQLIAALAPGTHETVGLRKDGTRVPVEVEATRFVHQGREALIVAVREVSERKRLEAELRQAQKMQVLGQLAGGIAHDFNNLLTVILGYSDLALEALPESARDIVGEVQQIRDAGRRAAALTSQLLAFSRRQVLDLQVVDLNEIISGVLRMLKRLIGEHISLHTVLQPSMDPIRADRGQIEQVLMNLVTNARDAMPDGGTLTIGTQEIYVSEHEANAMAPLHAGSHIVMTVADSGSGMDEETVSHIFEPFYTTKEPGRGTGLGLATVHGIVTQFNGYISVASSPAQGTAFRIFLPVAGQEKAPAAPVAEPKQVVPVADETILLVEDEPAVRRLAHDVLRTQGYTVLEATAEEALALGADYIGPIDLLVTDVVMPSIGGVELAGRLVQQRTELKVLFVSGYGDEVLQLDRDATMAVHFLQKPFTNAALLQKVRAILDGA